jgi:hypothetical protein
VSPFLLTRTLPEDATEKGLRADVFRGLPQTPAVHVAVLHGVPSRNASRPGW